MMDFAAARHNMVESQIRTNRVTDPGVIAAMGDVPRERFLPKHLQGVAYVDEDIPIGPGRYLMEPMVLARLLQEAAIQPGELVLNIGAGVGYDAAVMARFATTVVGLESDGALAKTAGRTLSELGVDNVAIVEGPLELGFPKQAPYDVIVFSGAVERVPPEIPQQLAPNGRLLMVIEPPGEPGRATLISRRGDVLSRRILFDAAVRTLPGFERERGFVF